MYNKYIQISIGGNEDNSLDYLLIAKRWAPRGRREVIIFISNELND